MAGTAIKVFGQSLTNLGVLDARNGGTLQVRMPLTIADPGILTTSASGTIALSDDVHGDTRNVDQYRVRGSVLLDGAGTPANPQLLEAMSGDWGAYSLSTVPNFVYTALTLANDTYVRLVDEADNFPGSTLEPEALYLSSLVVPAGATLDLNGLHAYVQVAQLDGALVGGTISQVPEGVLLYARPTAGRIAVPGEADEWRFESSWVGTITVVVNPGSGGSPAPPAPQLNYAEVQVLNYFGDVLASGSSTSGGIVTLKNVTLPSFYGSNRILVRAAAGHTGNTGDYYITLWNSSVAESRLALGQKVNGNIESPFSEDRWTFAATAGQSVQLDLVNATSQGLGFSLTGPAGFVGFTDITDDSGVVNLTEAGTYIVTVRSLVEQTGDYAFRLMDVAPIDLPLGTVYNATIASSGQSQFFRVEVPAARPLFVQLDGGSDTDRNELYVKFGTPPTRADFDYRFTNDASADQQVLVPLAAAGAWYILVYTEGAIHTPIHYALAANSADLFVTGVTPSFHGNSVEAVVGLTGVGFDPAAIVSLVAADATAYAAASVRVDSPTHLAATFAAGTVPAGVYTVRVELAGGNTAELADAFEMVEGGQARLETRLILPRNVRARGLSTLYVEYANTGTAAMPAPLLVVRGSARPLLTLDQSRVVRGFWTSAVPEGFSDKVYLLASGDSPGLLQPGERFRVPVYYAGLLPPWTASQVHFTLEILDGDNPTAIDWTGIKDELRPSSMNAAAWDVIYDNLKTAVGGTWGDYIRTLDDNAAYFGRLGQRVLDIGALWQFEVLQAIGLSVAPTLATATDAAVPSPGLPLNFRRRFSSSVISRNELGPFGWGWEVADGWLRTLQVEPDGTVAISGMGAGQRRFEPDSRAVGRYFSEAGDHATLTALAGGAFDLRESNGLLTHFRADGQVDYLEDPNGNRITAGYTNGRLTSLTHSSGQSLTIDYNPASRIERVTDSFGRSTLFSYDAANEYLLAVTESNGLTTGYSYDISGPPAAVHALLSIQYPDGSHRYFTYDNQGRLHTSARDGNAERITYTYDLAGIVAATDALGGTRRFFFDHRGVAAAYEDALGQTTYFGVDGNFNLTHVTDPAGQTYSFGYDSRGNLTQTTNPLGQLMTFSYTGDCNRLAAANDARGNTTQYGRDANGNLTSLAFVTGSIEHFTYDPDGSLDTWTNRRGQLIDYTFNTHGQLARKDLPDGTTIEYRYNARGNLESAIDPSGTTLLEYLDPQHPDLVTRITYPSGRFLEFSYLNGRRTRMVDQDGFAVTYHYDAAGRLETLRDGTGSLVVRYRYDPVGRLDRKELGNGTYTTYEYDVAGRLEHLVNHAPNGTVNSRFDYTYDLLDRRIGMTTLEGSWSYEYDLIGQLTRARFTSADPALIPHQDLQYEYDAAGNRVRTILNGVTTEYTANNLDQYIQVGTVSQAYDLDGNLIHRTDGAATDVFGYNAENRLVSVVTAAGTWTYAYDAFGNRTATVQNGQRTEFLIDPFALGNVVAEYETGGPAVRYVHGFGLVSRVDSLGAVHFYDFDALGSTAGLTDATGGYVNHYSYLPFGESLAATQTVANSFRFVGAFGVMEEGNGLQFMRNRFYEPVLGVFTTADPLRGPVRDAYLYVESNPLTFVDPEGLDEECTDADCAWDAIASDPETEMEDHIFSEAEGGLPGPPSLEELERAHGVGDDGDGFGVGGDDGDDGGGFEGPVICLLIPPLCSPDPPPPQPPPPPPGAPGGDGDSDVPIAWDPNQKVGASGFGPAAFVLPNKLLAYRIDFENEASATAPAQRVVVTDQLDSDLDWSTFAFTSVGFGDVLVDIPAGDQYFQTTVPMIYNNQSFQVEIELGLNSQTGLVSVVFQSIDPATSLPPGVLAGFLPPEDGTGRGMGHFSYIIYPKAGLPTGTEIRNVALIIFDVNEPIATNQVDPHDPSQGTDPTKEALNTIDAGAPASGVAALPAVTSTTTFMVSWSGVDDANGSGIAHYDVYVALDSGPFAPWLTGTTATSASYTGADNHTYAFYSVATDNVGHRQPTPAAAQATTQVLINEAPVLAAIGNRVIDEGSLLSITLTATDPDMGDVLTYTATGLPAGATFNPATRTFTWTPTESQGPGSFHVTFTVRDSSLSDAETITITVREVNRAPVLTAIGNRSVNEGSLLSFTLAATDSDLPANSLTYTATGLPAGATFNAATRTFTWTPTEDQGPGSYQVAFTVSDGSLSDAETISLTVHEVNTAPVLAPIGNQVVDEGHLLGLRLVATEGDRPAQALTWTASGLPPGAAFDSATQTFTWTPAEAQGPGSYLVTFRVSDGSLGDSETITITVREVNTAPVLAAIGNRSVNEGTALSFTLSASDGDVPANPLTWMASALPPGPTFDPATQTFTWTPAEDQGPGSYAVTFTVSDGSLSDTETITITVAEANCAPVLAPIGDQSVAEGSVLTLTLDASDSDLPANALTYAVTELQPGAAFDPIAHTFTWTPTETQGPGSYPITFSVSDGNLTDAETITVAVTEVNTAPVLAPIGNQTVMEDYLLTLTLTASDSDWPANVLTYAATGLPAGATFDAAAAKFQWTPTEEQAPGTYAVTFTVSDGSQSASETITIYVQAEPYGEVQFTADSYTVAEGSGTFSIPIHLSDAYGRAVSVAYRVTVPESLRVQDRATPGQDFQVPLEGVLTFAAGEQDMLLTLDITNDDLVEADPETFLITLDEPTGGIGLGVPAEATVHLADDDLPPGDDALPDPARLQWAALQIGSSEEHYGNFVHQAYQRFLVREPDAQGFAYWVGLLRLYDTSQHTQGLRQEQVEAGFLASPEYQARYGGTGQAWIEGMYSDLLGRAGEAAGVDYWMARLEAGVSAAEIAHGFASSEERLRNRVTESYWALLGRAPEEGGMAYWLAALRQGWSLGEMVGGILSAPEYRLEATQGSSKAAPWVRSAYLDVLFRPATVAEYDYWMPLLIA